MTNLNLLKGTSVKMAALVATTATPAVQPESTNSATLLNRLMAEVINARNASQQALRDLRKSRASSEDALRELRRTRQEVQLRRQNLLRALAAHQKA